MCTTTHKTKDTHTNGIYSEASVMYVLKHDLLETYTLSIRRI